MTVNAERCQDCKHEISSHCTECKFCHYPMTDTKACGCPVFRKAA